MKQKNFLNNTVFRLVTPIVYGILVYVLILLIFDSIDQLYVNFFTGQVLIIIGLTFLISEITRLVIKLIDIIYPNDYNLRARITSQLLSTIGTTILITSIVMSAYFNYLVGIKNYNTELIVFNSIYLITSIIYNMLYFSIYFLHRLNNLKLQHENQLKTELESELKAYKNKINPEFLFSSFETLIGLSKTNVDEADSFVNKLSKLYRYILAQKKNELINVLNEIAAVNVYMELINYKYSGNVVLSNAMAKQEEQLQIVPGSLLTCIEIIIKTSIISSINQLKIEISNNEKCIFIKHIKNQRVMPLKSSFAEIENLNRAYSFFSKYRLKIKEENNEQVFEIPILITQ